MQNVCVAYLVVLLLVQNCATWLEFCFTKFIKSQYGEVQVVYKIKRLFMANTIHVFTHPISYMTTLLSEWY